MISAIVALIGLVITGIAKYNGLANFNKEQAASYAGKPAEILEIKKWTSQPKTIWVKVDLMAYFAVNNTVTIIDGVNGNTQFKGRYTVKDAWENFPTGDPGRIKRALLFQQALLGMAPWWKMEKLPYQHNAAPGVLKLEALESLPNVNEGPGNGLIFSGTEYRPDIGQEAAEKIKALKSALLTGPNSWKTAAAAFLLLAIIFFIKTKK